MKTTKIRKRIADLKSTQENEASKSKTRKRKTKNYYFSKEVQDEIVNYQNAELFEEKNKIYKEHIAPAFNNLVQSLVSVYKFKATNEDIEHLKSDCVSFLFETIYKWKPDKGKKAFSYFNVVAKNYLTIQTRRMLKNNNRNVYLDDQMSLSNVDRKFVFEKEYVDGDIALANSYKRYLKIIEIIDFIIEKLTDEQDLRCCYAIKKLYEDIDDIEFFNKRAIFLYLREISGLNSSELSSSLSSIRKIYRKNIEHNSLFDIFDIEE